MTALVHSKAAKLPINYEHAIDALEKCEKIDECKAWKDKVAALASYAKQAGDDTLFKAASRIQARAMRRAGELLKETEPKHTGRIRTGAGINSDTRAAVADAAGLSKRQKDDALRIASIPKREFEKLVESDDPPTLTLLAKMGTVSKPIDHLNGRDPKEFNVSIHARGQMEDMAKMCGEVTPAIVVRGSNEYDLPNMKAWAKTIASWISRMQTTLEK